MSAAVIQTKQFVAAVNGVRTEVMLLLPEYRDTNR